MSERDIHQPYVYVGMSRQDLCAAIPGTVFDELGEWMAAHDLTLRDVRDKLALHLRWVDQAIAAAEDPLPPVESLCDQCDKPMIGGTFGGGLPSSQWCAEHDPTLGPDYDPFYDVEGVPC